MHERKLPTEQRLCREWYISKDRPLSETVLDPATLGKNAAKQLQKIPRAELDQLTLFEITHIVRSNIYYRNKIKYTLIEDSDSDNEEERIAQQQPPEYIVLLQAPVLAKSMPKTGAEFHELALALENNTRFQDAYCWVEERKKNALIKQLKLHAKKLRYIPKEPINIEMPKEPIKIERGSIISLRKNHNRLFICAESEPTRTTSISSNPSSSDSDNSIPSQSPESSKTPPSSPESGQVLDHIAVPNRI